MLGSSILILETLKFVSAKCHAHCNDNKPTKTVEDLGFHAEINMLTTNVLVTSIHVDRPKENFDGI